MRYEDFITKIGRVPEVGRDYVCISDYYDGYCDAMSDEDCFENHGLLIS